MARSELFLVSADPCVDGPPRAQRTGDDRRLHGERHHLRLHHGHNGHPLGEEVTLMAKLGRFLNARGTTVLVRLGSHEGLATFSQPHEAQRQQRTATRIPQVRLVMG